MKSLNLYLVGLIVQRMALTGGASPVDYLKAFNITLFLTSEEKDVEEALKQGEEKFFFIFIWSLCLRIMRII